ncbi:MAG: hypothetical protein WBQ94_04395 [Terracidiphilus sp.]
MTTNLEKYLAGEPLNEKLALLKETPWRIADGRRQFCIPCSKQGHTPPPVEKKREPAAKQGELF